MSLQSGPRELEPVTAQHAAVREGRRVGEAKEESMGGRMDDLECWQRGRGASEGTLSAPTLPPRERLREVRSSIRYWRCTSYGPGAALVLWMQHWSREVRCLPSWS